jgi:hypothetical protein
MYMQTDSVGVRTSLPNSSAQRKSQSQTELPDAQADRFHRKLQRILRPADTVPDGLSGGTGTVEHRMSEKMKEATLSPRLVNPVSVPQDDSPLFQCTECDMIVKESDPYCPFCGAIFADAGPDEQTGSESGHPKPPSDEPTIEKPARREPMVRPEMFDLFGLLGSRSRSKDLLYREALRGFPGSARLLEEIEHLISDISSLGTDTTKARRLMGSAWEAARDGNWNLVTTLAHQTEEMVAPNIPDLVRSEISRARAHLAEAKALGIDISQYIIQIKSAIQALHANDTDEALRITKELTDSMREDSISWK